jgi:O-antigen/teichoic acid export membrane protein
MSKAFGRAATVKAAFLMTGSTYVSFALGMLVSALIARSLGPEEFGRYAYLVWLSGLLVMVANNGLTTTVIRFVSESIGRNQHVVAGDVHGWLLRAQHLSLVAVAITFVLVLEWTLPAGWADHVALFGGAVLISLIAKSLYLFAISTAKGAGQYAVEAASTVGMSLVNMAGVGVLFLMHAQMAAYVALFAVTSLGYFVAAQWMLRRRGIVATRNALEPELAQQIRQHLFWTVVLAVAAAFGNKASETFLLNRYVGPVEVGFFSVAAALTRGGIELLSAGLTTVLMPAMAHAYGAGGKSRAHSILSDSVRYFGFAGLLLAGVGFMWADLVVELMYGAAYKPVAGVLQVMVVVAGLTLPQGAFGALLSTTNHQKLRAIVAALSLVVSAAAALLLVPTYGLTGAVIANAASTLVLFVAIAALLARHLSVQFPWSQLIKLMVAALISAGVVGLLPWMYPGNISHLVAGAMYAVVLTVMSVTLGAWTDADIGHMISVATRFPRFFGWLLPMLNKRTRGT